MFDCVQAAQVDVLTSQGTSDCKIGLCRPDNLRNGDARSGFEEGRTPAPREEALANLFKSVGGKLIGWCLTFGRHDCLVIGECRRQSRHR